jgi:hypothetical protein
LYTHTNGAWLLPQRYTYTAQSGCAPAVAQIISPTPQTTLPASSATFTWNAVAGADQYWLDVGSTPGVGDLSAGATANTSRLVTGLPCNAHTLYVQLFTHVNGAWLSPQRYTYTAPAACGP